MDKENGGNGSGTDKVSDLAAAILEARKDGAAGDEPGLNEPEKTAEATKAAIDNLFNEEHFEMVVQMCSELPYALTGWEGWLLSPKETRVLTTSTKSVAREFVRMDTRNLVLLMASINVLAIFGPRIIAYAKRPKAKAEVKKSEA